MAATAHDYPAQPRRLAIIPARGGSVGVPRKNLAMVGGQTLLARAIRCAQDSGCFALILVSTDDPEIAQEGRRAGAAVPFLRPAALASSTAAVVDAVRYTLQRLQDENADVFDLVALLEPTSPMRTPQIVRDVVAAAESPGADAALSVSPVPLHFHAAKQFSISSAGLIEHVLPAGASVTNRQELTTTYIRNGMCYAVRRAALESSGRLLGTAARAVIVEGPYANIDSPEDLALARRLIEDDARQRAV